jgi:dCMP deaminase
MKSPRKRSRKKHPRLSWDDYFLGLVKATSKRSTCNRGKSSCVIVKNKQILATGYSGSPAGLPHCDDVGHQIKKLVHEDGTETKHCLRTVHAEQNAICQAAKRGIAIEGAVIYLSMTPCRTCTMLLINCGIKCVICKQKYHAGAESEKMLKKANIKIKYKTRKVQKYKNQ